MRVVSRVQKPRIEDPRSCVRAVFLRDEPIADRSAKSIEPFASFCADREIGLMLPFIMLPCIVLSCRACCVVARIVHAIDLREHAEIGRAIKLRPRDLWRGECNHEIRIGQKPAREIDRGHLNFVGTRAKAGQIEPFHDKTAEVDARADRIARCPFFGAHDRSFSAKKRVR